MHLRFQQCVASSLVLIAVALGSTLGHDRPQDGTTGRVVERNARIQGTLEAVPGPFVPNVGQWDHDAAFVARFGPMTLFLSDDGWTFTLVERASDAAGQRSEGHARGVAVRMTFAGDRAAKLAPRGRGAGVHHYLFGADKARWRRDVPSFDVVQYHGIRPGFDVVARGQDGHFEYDLFLAPDARLDEIEMTVAGIESTRIQRHLEP